VSCAWTGEVLAAAREVSPAPNADSNDRSALTTLYGNPEAISMGGANQTVGSCRLPDPIDTRVGTAQGCRQHRNVGDRLCRRICPVSPYSRPAALQKSMGLMTSYADTIIFFLTNALIYTKYWRLVIAYIIHFHRLPNIAKPTKLSEMVQWRKCFDKNPIFTVFADKLLAKQWVDGKVSNLNIPKTVWVGATPKEIPEKYLENGFVLKTNHACGTNYFPNRGRHSRADVERIFRKWLSVDWSKYYSEWSYSAVQRKIFVEELIREKDGLLDISIRAHDGDVSIASVATNWKMDDQRYGYYLPDGSRYDDEFDFVSVPKKYKLTRDFVVPQSFFKAVDAAKILSIGLDYIRVDFLASSSNLFFSEMTVYPASGFSPDGSFSEIVVRYWIKYFEKSWFFKTRHSGFRNIYYASAMRYFMSLR
jgi:hypothetical protein